VPASCRLAAGLPLDVGGSETIMKLGRTKRPAAKTATAVTFSAADLEALGRLVAAGQAVIGGHGPAHRVVARLKAAMTQLAVLVPRGL
jgi:hypothetical protein